LLFRTNAKALKSYARALKSHATAGKKHASPVFCKNMAKRKQTKTYTKESATPLILLREWLIKTIV